MNTIQLTDEQMKALQSGKPITIEPPKPVIQKWEPKGGEYTIRSSFNGSYYEKSTTGITPDRLSGLEYQTQSQAEQAAKALRSYARQLSWLAENDDGWIADWNDTKVQRKYCVLFDNIHNKYFHEVYMHSKFINSVFMSEKNAKKLCQLLNDGIVEF